MKLFKKLLAVTLAGVLALSVLTGCGGSKKSLLEALNSAGNGVKFTLDKDAGGQMTQAEAKQLVNKIDEIAENAELKDLPLDELVGYAVAAVMTGELPTLHSDEPEIASETFNYAVVKNTLSTKKQATEAINNAKKMTISEDKEDGGYDCEIVPTKLDSKNGYEVAYTTLTTTKKGTFILISFNEAEPAQSESK